MESPVLVAVEKPQAASETVSGLMPRARNAREMLRPCHFLRSQNRTIVGRHSRQEEKERDRIAVSMWPPSKLSPNSSAVTVTLAGLNSMRSMA